MLRDKLKKVRMTAISLMAHGSDINESDVVDAALAVVGAVFMFFLESYGSPWYMSLTACLVSVAGIAYRLPCSGSIERVGRAIGASVAFGGGILVCFCFHFDSIGMGVFGLIMVGAAHAAKRLYMEEAAKNLN